MEVIYLSNYGRLLKHEGKLIAEIRAGNGAADFSAFIELTAEESKEYKIFGKVFIDYFLYKTGYYSTWKNRQVSEQIAQLASEAING